MMRSGRAVRGSPDAGAGSRIDNDPPPHDVPSSAASIDQLAAHASSSRRAKPAFARGTQVSVADIQRYRDTSVPRQKR